MSALARQATEAIVKAGRGVHFPADMRVSANSLLGDDSWCYSDSDKPRLKLYPDRLLTIVWRGPDAHAGCELPGLVLDVLKSFAFLYQNSPGTVVYRATKQTNHPRTVCQALQAVLAFLGHVFEANGLPLGDCDFSLADIKLSHLRAALKKWGGCNQRNLKLCLTGLTFLLLRKIHPDTAPGWTASDIAGLKFRKPTPREEDNKVLPAPLFRLASNSASSVVCGFLTLLGTEVLSGEAGVLPQFLEPHRHQGRLLFTSYTELRHVRATEVGTPGFNVRGSACATILNKRFRATFKCTAKQMKDYLHQVHRAANALIALYTGWPLL